MEEAKRLFRVYTGGTGRLDCLYGPGKASCRAHILSAMAGRRVPQSKAGWNVFCSEMYRLFGATGNCIRARELSVQELAKV